MTNAEMLREMTDKAKAIQAFCEEQMHCSACPFSVTKCVKGPDFIAPSVHVCRLGDPLSWDLDR